MSGVQGATDILSQISALDDQAKALSKTIGALKRSSNEEDQAKALQVIQDVSAIHKQVAVLKEALQDLEVESKKNESAKKSHEHDAPLSQCAPDFLNLEKLQAYYESFNVDIAIDDLIVRPIRQDDKPALLTFLATHPGATFYHDVRWQRVIPHAFGHETSAFVAASDKGDIFGYLPYTHLSSMLFGQYAVSLPYVNYGGPLAISAEIEIMLVQQAWRLLWVKAVPHFEVRMMRTLSHLMPVRDEKVSMILALPDSSASLDKQLGTKIRAQIKRAKRESPEVLVGKAELVNDFYRVFARNMRDLGTPVYSKQFFKTMMSSFYESSHIVVLKWKKKPVAVAWLFEHNGVMEIPWASTLRKVNSLSFNMLLYWEVLNLAISSGQQFFDFGRSTQDAPTYRFKKQWGAQPYQHHWYYCLPEGESLPALNPQNPKFQLAIKLWQKMPVWLTKCIGPWVVKGLP